MLGRLFTPRLFGARAEALAAEALYRAIVARAREPRFYTDEAVPDTLDGRFDMVALHAVLVLRRVSELDRAGRDLAQRTFDLMFDDMDRSLREMGVGDLSVPKKIKAMVQAFFGRARAYGEAVAARDANALAEALTRNLYRSAPADPSAPARMAAYVLAFDGALAAQSPENLFAGRFEPDPAPVAVA